MFRKMQGKTITTLTATSVFIAFVFSMLLSSASAQVADNQIQGPQNNTEQYSGIVYGPIDKNDTLWRIASRYKQRRNFSVYQIMLAIFELNPQAFENGNVNTMISGATLQLPSDQYIATIDPEIARLKAEADSQQYSKPSSNTQTKSPSPDTSSLVNKDDLSKSKAEFQGQINDLKSQQQEQFESLKEQVAQSIQTVEVLLAENKRLNQQLSQIDETNKSLTSAVETELQSQIDDQVAQLGELIKLVQASEQKRIEKESQSFFQILSSPTAIIIIMFSVTLLVLVGLAVILLRKPAVATVDAPEQGVAVPTPPVPVESTESAETASESSDDDLLAALSEQSNELDDSEEDDILSDALEEDEAIADLDEQSLADSLDDMLVPDNQSDVADAIEMSELGDDEDEEGISLDDEDAISLDDQDVDVESEPSEDDTTEGESSTAGNNAIAVDQSAGTQGTPDGIDLNDKGDIDENTLQQIDTQIEDSDEKITSMADEILEQLDNESDDEEDEAELDETEDNSEQEVSESEEEVDIDALLEQSLDEPIDENETDAADQEEEVIDIDALLDEPLDQAIDEELDVDVTEDVENSSSEAEEEFDIDALLDEQSESLTASVDEQAEQIESLEQEEVAEVSDEVDDLSSDLLEELQSDDQQSDELDSLLEETDFTQDDTDASLLDQDIDQVELSEAEQAPSAESSVLDDLVADIPSLDDELELDVEKLNESVQLEAAADDLTNSDLESMESGDDVSQDSELNEQQQSSDDVLASLPDLDNWLDGELEPEREDAEKLVSDLAEISQTDDELDLSALELDIDDIDPLNSEKSDESSLIQQLDDANFDDMLLDLSEPESTAQDSIDPASDDQKDETSSPLIDAGLDIDTLLEQPNETPEPAVSGAAESEEQDFVDVDDLLRESEALSETSDEEKPLDLASSLPQQTVAGEQQTSAETNDAEAEQAGNLDLAQVYIDMDDTEAAKETLEEVIANGNEQQREEAQALLDSLK